MVESKQSLRSQPPLDQIVFDSYENSTTLDAATRCDKVRYDTAVEAKEKVRYESLHAACCESPGVVRYDSDETDFMEVRYDFVPPSFAVEQSVMVASKWDQFQDSDDEIPLPAYKGRFEPI